MCFAKEELRLLVVEGSPRHQQLHNAEGKAFLSLLLDILVPSYSVLVEKVAFTHAGASYEGMQWHVVGWAPSYHLFVMLDGRPLRDSIHLNEA